MSLCHGCPSDPCVQKHCWWPWGFWGHDWELQDLVRLEVHGLLPLVALALGGPEEALRWLLSQLLRHFFVEICGNELEGLALLAWGQKSLFPCQPTLHHLFCYTGMVTLRRDILVAVHLFMAHCFSCGQGCTQECAWVHVRQMLPLGMLPKGKQFQNHSFTMYLKNGDKVGPQSLKKTRLIFFYVFPSFSTEPI